MVVAIIAIASAGVSFALRDSGATQLEREAQRLAALLESARAQSRSSGVPVRWYATDGGFRFDGVPPNALPDRWLAETTQVRGTATLQLGPEPIIGPAGGRARIHRAARAQPARRNRRAAAVRRRRPGVRARDDEAALRGTPPGFTLIEVLVALAIVAIALAAGLQATSALTRNALRQSSVLLAHLCAENELVKVRLSSQMPAIGDTSVSCEQGGRNFGVTVSVLPTPNPSFRRVDAQVFEDRSPVLRLSTVVGRF